MKTLCVEGWRFIHHSFAMVNQWQLLSLLKRHDISLSTRDVPFFVTAQVGWMAHERRRDLAKFEGSLVRAPMMFQPCFLAVEKKERMTAKSIAPSHDRNLREINGKITNETRFYITSLVTLANAVGPMIRAHWAIENSLHWVMDMVFRDDECRVRTDNAPANFATCRHIAYNLTRKAPCQDSIRLRRQTAGWDAQHLASLIAALFH